MLHKKSSGVVDVGPEKGREEKVLISLTQSDDPNYPSDFMYNIVWRLVRFFICHNTVSACSAGSLHLAPSFRQSFLSEASITPQEYKP